MNPSRKLLEAQLNRVPREPQLSDRIRELYASPSHDPTISDYWRILAKRKWMILICALVMVIVAGLVSLRITRIYEAAARISTSGQTSNFLNFSDKAQAADAGSDQFGIDTQVKILQSNTLALLVIRNLGLDKRPEFAGPAASEAKHGVVSKLSPQDLGREEQLMQEFRENLRVQQIPNTAIVEIKYSSPSPALAAEVANATAESFIEQNIKARYDSTMQAADWLSKQLADLQIKVEVSQAKLVEYQQQNRIIGADDKQNLTVEKLNGLSKELTQAQADRIQKQSFYEITKGGNPETIGIILQDPSLAALRQQQTELEAQDAQLSTQFGSSYPKVQEVRSRLKLIKEAYNKELQNGIRRVQNDYDAALKREQMLQGALDAQTDVANQLNVSAIQYKLLKQEADSNRQLYDGLLEKLKEASLAAALKSSNIRIVDKARVPMVPARPNIPRNLEIALVLGLVVGIGMAFALESMDATVRTPEHVEAISGLPTLTIIPLKRELQRQGPRSSRAPLETKLPDWAPRGVSLIAYLEPQSEMAEAYRALRTSILLSSAGGPPHSIVVTSPMPQDGKTMTSINIAIVLAQQGKKVLLVDADLRRPSVHQSFGLRQQLGLSNVLSGGVDAGTATVTTGQRNLFVMPAGALPPQPSELLSSALMQELLSRWRDEYDHVIIDSPPALSVTDAVLLSVQADAVLLVVRASQTTTGAVVRTRDLLLHVKCNLLGVVLNAVDLASLGDYYSGSRYSLYYTDSKRKGGSRAQAGDDDGQDEPRSASSGDL
jgi:succinoglycan biosynthesis transport protein ExoP